MSQPDFLYELFEDFMDDPANQDFSMDNGLVCRWLTGQAKISPKISAYYSKPSNQKKLAETIHQNLLPLMSDCNHKGMNGIIQELKGLLKTKNIGTDSDRALLLDFQATLETKPEKAIKLEKDALAQIENITADNARLVSNLHANLGGLYRMNGHPDLAREHMEKKYLTA